MRNIRFGVIGNMGPEADELFQSHIRKATGAKTDQEHISVTVIKNPDIPDRTEAIINNGKDPVPEILNSIQALESVGVQFAVMPCNTAHYFRASLQKQTSIFLLDMLDTVIKTIKQDDPSLGSVGLLATNGTVKSGIYVPYAQKAGLKLITPNDDSQERNVHAAIYGPKRMDSERREPKGIKAGFYQSNAELLIRAVEEMGSPKVVILGCTELPIVSNILKEGLPNTVFYDPMEAAAKRAVQIYHQAERQFEESSVITLKNAERIHKHPGEISNDEDIVSYIVAKALQDKNKKLNRRDHSR